MYYTLSKHTLYVEQILQGSILQTVFCSLATPGLILWCDGNVCLMRSETGVQECERFSFSSSLSAPQACDGH